MHPPTSISPSPTPPLLLDLASALTDPTFVCGTWGADNQKIPGVVVKSDLGKVRIDACIYSLMPLPTRGCGGLHCVHLSLMAYLM